MYTISLTTPTLTPSLLKALADLADTMKVTSDKDEAPKAEKTVKATAAKEIEKPAKDEGKPVMPGFLANKKAPAASEVDFKKIKDTAMEVVRTINRDTGLAILKQFGAESTSALSPEHYSDFLRAANEVLENHNKKKNDDIL